MAPPYLPDLKQPGGRRAFDYEAAAAAAAAAAAKVLAGKTASSCAPTTSASGGSPVAASAGAMMMNGWQESAIDLTKTSGEISTTGTGEAAATPGMGHHGDSDGAAQKLPPPPPPITAPLAGCVGIDMAGILQAGLIHPVTGQIINGNLRGDDSLKRRRGRRRNVEALYSEFAKSRGLHVQDAKVGGGTGGGRADLAQSCNGKPCNFGRIRRYAFLHYFIISDAKTHQPNETTDQVRLGQSGALTLQYA